MSRHDVSRISLSPKPEGSSLDKRNARFSHYFEYFLPSVIAHPQYRPKCIRREQDILPHTCCHLKVSNDRISTPNNEIFVTQNSLFSTTNGKTTNNTVDVARDCAHPSVLCEQKPAKVNYDASAHNFSKIDRDRYTNWNRIVIAPASSRAKVHDRCSSHNYSKNCCARYPMKNRINKVSIVPLNARHLLFNRLQYIPNSFNLG